MKARTWRKAWLSIGATVGLLALVWLASTALAQEPEGEATPQGDVSVAQDVVAGKILYQGRLMDPSGVPLDGNFDMRFEVYTEPTGIMGLVWASGLIDVEVDHGLFNVDLSITPSLVRGWELWLGIQVDGEWLTPRQELVPVPFALSLRPGAWVVGDVASPSAVINIMQADDESEAFGLYAYGPTTGIYGDGVETGVRGHSYGHVGGRAGVYGDSVVGYGVRGSSLYYVGVWAGSHTGNVIEGHEVNEEGNSVARVFRVSHQGDVYADRAYHCGLDDDGISNSYIDENAGCMYDLSPADFAEVLPVANDPEPGDVLVIGWDGRLALSSEPYQSSVAGVYSTRPSYVGGAANLGEEGYVPVAIVGLAPVKVSAENGPIVPGDLLTTASLPGYAMKASPIDLDGVEIYRPGTIIGKALESLDEGTGEISALITLQ